MIDRRLAPGAFVLMMSIACCGEDSSEDLLDPDGGIQADGIVHFDGVAYADGVVADASEPGLELKIGQMLMVSFSDERFDHNSAIAEDIRNNRVGGVVLFDHNLVVGDACKEQLQELLNGLQDLSDTPLLIGIDQEGGRIVRLKEEYGFPATVSHQYLGQMDDPQLTYDSAFTIAQTLSEVGINQNLAPVVDLNVNPSSPAIGALERSFSADPNIVINHATQFIEAHHDYQVACTLKHFPGHGSATTDSHNGAVDVTQTHTDQELEPYRQLINKGLADVIMTAHVFNARIDPQYPATLSAATINGLLRGELGYDGVVMSDDLGMQAITEHYSFELAIELALRAGVDILLLCNNSETSPTARQAFELIKNLALSDDSIRQHVERAYERIQRLKGSS